MPELAGLILLSAIEIAALLIAARQAVVYRDPARLRMYVVINMVLVLLLGSYLVQIGGVTTNIASVFYAGAMFGIITKIEQYGARVGDGLIRAIWFTMSLTFLLTQIMVLFPVVHGNEDLAGAMRLIRSHNATMILASYAAVTAAIVVIIQVYRSFRSEWGPIPTALAALVIGQAVDSVVFYPLAFYSQGMNFVIVAALSGFAIKIAVGIAGLPAIAAVRYSRHFSPPPTRSDLIESGP